MDKKNIREGEKLNRLFLSIHKIRQRRSTGSDYEFGKGFPLDPIWGDFNAETRGIMLKKMEKVF